MSGPVVLLTALLAPMVAVAAVNLVAAPRLHRERGDVTGPRVSVLIPARDEADNLRRLLPAVLASVYGRLEVLVLNDDSTDETGAVVAGFAASDPRLRAIDGSEPPQGWTGKNWACRQLADAADGDILLFCDADVRPGPRAVSRTVAALERTGADALTALPRHERGGWFEHAIIPLVAIVPVVALLPLPLVRRTRAPSLAVGNGQWFAWRRSAYRVVGGHNRVRSDVLEDVRLARLLKAEGLSLAPYLADQDLAVRMYRDPTSAWEGFVKNTYLLAGGRPWTLAVTVAVLLTAGLGPVVAAVWPGLGPWAVVPLAELVAVRVMAAAAVDDGAVSVLLHPVGVVLTAALAVASWRRHRDGTVAWKRRTVRHEEPA